VLVAGIVVGGLPDRSTHTITECETLAKQNFGWLCSIFSLNGSEGADAIESFVPAKLTSDVRIIRRINRR